MTQTSPLPTPVPHLYLVDGSGYIFRAYHKLPPLNNPAGVPVNALFGFTSMIGKLIEDLRGAAHPTHLAVILDAGRQSFRHALYPAYKANRPPAPEDLVPQFPLIRDAVRAFGVPCIEQVDYEADDLIASYAQRACERGWSVTVVSSDKDLMQLVQPGLDLFDPLKNIRLDAAAVVEKFGVGPDKVIEVQALMGDSSDNVPGVPGIGPKTAAELIVRYGDVETLLAHVDEITQPKRRQALIDHADKARLSRELVTLKRDMPLPQSLDSLAIGAPDPAVLAAFFDLHGFRTLKAKLPAAVETVATRPATALDTSAYVCVTDLATLEDWIAQAVAQGVVAVDTETTSLDAMQAELVGFSLALAPGRACYVPLRHETAEGLLGETPVQLDFAAAVSRLGTLLADPSVLKIAHNSKYDRLVLARLGLVWVNVDDTMLLSYVLDSGVHTHGLDALAQTHFGHQTIAYKDVTGSGKAQIPFAHVPLDRATAYAGEDAEVTWRLWERLKPRLWAEKLTTVYETLERPLVPVLVAMERAGITVDRAELARLSQDFAARMAVLETEIHGLAGGPFNLASPKQVGEILFEQMGLKGGKKGKAGAWSTDAETLDRLAEEGVLLAARLLDWRQLAKLKSTYTDALQQQINPQTGRVHTSYAMAATTTGRLSSTDPNLQNIPIRHDTGRAIRAAFVAPPGRVLLAADYSQIELRLLAHMADVPSLQEAFAQGADIHALTAAEVFGVPLDAVDSTLRRRAKAINFGVIYGISAFGLARQIDVGRSEAQAFINRYFERFPGIRASMDAAIAQCREQGYVETLFGRRIHIPGIRDKNPAMRTFAERQAINAPLQGSAADLIRRAMCRLPGALAEAGLDAVQMLLQVHDELLFEAPAALAQAATPLIARVMAEAGAPVLALRTPLVVAVGVGQNWSQAH